MARDPTTHDHKTPILTVQNNNSTSTQTPPFHLLPTRSSSNYILTGATAPRHRGIHDNTSDKPWKPLMTSPGQHSDAFSHGASSPSPRPYQTDFAR